MNIVVDDLSGPRLSATCRCPRIVPVVWSIAATRNVRPASSASASTAETTRCNRPSCQRALTGRPAVGGG